MLIYPSFFLHGNNCQDPRVRNFQKYQVVTVGLKGGFLWDVSVLMFLQRYFLLLSFISLPVDFIRRLSCSFVVISS